MKPGITGVMALAMLLAAQCSATINIKRTDTSGLYPMKPRQTTVTKATDDATTTSTKKSNTPSQVRNTHNQKERQNDETSLFSSLDVIFKFLKKARIPKTSWFTILQKLHQYAKRNGYLDRIYASLLLALQNVIKRGKDIGKLNVTDFSIPSPAFTVAGRRNTLSRKKRSSVPVVSVDMDFTKMPSSVEEMLKRILASMNITDIDDVTFVLSNSSAAENETVFTNVTSVTSNTTTNDTSVTTVTLSDVNYTTTTVTVIDSATDTTSQETTILNNTEVAVTENPSAGNDNNIGITDSGSANKTDATVTYEETVRNASNENTNSSSCTDSSNSTESETTRTVSREKERATVAGHDSEEETTSQTTSLPTNASLDRSAKESVNNVTVPTQTSNTTAAGLTPNVSKESLKPKPRRCPCKCKKNAHTPQRHPKVHAKIKRIKAKLSVNRSELSSARRKLQSSPDTRVSSQTIGYLGIVLFSLGFGLIFVPDCLAFVLFVKSVITQKCGFIG